MTAYYNEIEPFAANWLRNLISAGLIAPGEVDTRSIKDVTEDDVRGFTQCHFFAGIGGWSLALRIAGWPDSSPAWTGSCPCQPFSAAGKRKGTDDERHLWPEFRRLIAECKPSVVFGEQVASKDGRQWLAGVRLDLEALGYGVGSADLCAAGTGEEGEGWVCYDDGDGHFDYVRERIVIGAPHIRQRLFWVADANINRGAECLDDAGERAAGEEIDAAECTGARRLADDSQYGRREGDQNIGRCDSRIRAEGNRGGLADSGQLGRLGVTAGQRDRTDADAGGNCQGEREWRQRVIGGSGSSGELGNASEQRLSLPECSELSGAQQFYEGQAAQQSGLSSWSDFTIIPCLDGKSRRIEPSSFPLVDGIPRDMGSGRSKLDRVAIRAARANRTGRLKGYGNAIVPELAAEFISAFLEC